MKTRFAFFALAALSIAACDKAPKEAADLKLNDKEYFETQGVNVLVFSNTFSGGFNDEKNSGIEIIHHGVRTVQGGAVRLNKTPEQWDLVPASPRRTVDSVNQSIEVVMRYADYDFDSRVVVTAKGKAVEIAVYLDKPVPEFLAGKAGFNLEFLPSQYWGKTYLMDGRPNRFPRYAVSQTQAVSNDEKPRQFKGFRTYDDRGTGEFVDPLPLETGHNILIAPDEPERMIKISSDDATLELYDGRMIAQNGWFVLRSVLPAGKTGKVVTWMVEPNTIPGWIREPNIGFSQVGYVPSQPKVAVIELDKMDKPLKTASIYKIEDDGSEKLAYKGNIDVWGMYYKYNYVKFDFSEVREPGVYFIKYGDYQTGNFIIDNSVYNWITDATSDVWIPIHMNHMTVNEGYRIWHGEPFKEGYLQAPQSDHFDLHSQGAQTNTKYKPYELIPGLNVGGYFDAGDFDIETGSNISVVQNMVAAWELFHPTRDETFVSEEQRYVDLHRPDGKPDLLQYIEHGVLNLLAQAENIGFMSQTLSNSVLDNYHHLGDAAAITDGLHYDPSLPKYVKSADGKRSGTPDDMWAFTNRNLNSDMNAANMFAAASRVLKGYNDDLAARCLKQSKRLQEEATKLMSQRGAGMGRMGGQGFQGGQFPQGGQRPQGAQAGQRPQGAPQGGQNAQRPQAPQGGQRPQGGQNAQGGQGFQNQNFNRQGAGNMATNLQLYIATGEKSYIDQFVEQIWPALDRNVNNSIRTAMDAIPYMDAAYKERLRPYAEKYKDYLEQVSNNNPYGVPIGEGNWAGSGAVVTYGTTAAFANLYFPDIIDKKYAYNAAAFMFGCHPYHNYSLVAAVGAARPKQVFYGNNRADFSFIPGNVAPGLLFRRPDHFENFDDWPFLWGQNEGTIAGNTSYYIFGEAFKQMAK